MRASDIGGVGGPAATPAPGPVVAAPAPGGAVAGGIGGGSSINNILQQNAYIVTSINCRGSVVKAAAHDPQGSGFDTCQVHF